MAIPSLNLNDTIAAIATPLGTGGVAIIRITGPQAIQTAQTIWKGKNLTQTPPRTSTLGYIIDPRNNQTLDQALATVYHTPASFTGQDTVELAIHGSQFLQQEILQTILQTTPARLANPGEFTRRAFASGKIDLPQAEATADIIAAQSRAAARIAASQLKGGIAKTILPLRTQLINLASLLELELDFSDQEVQFADRTQLTTLTTQLLNQIKSLHHSFLTGNAIKNGIPTAIIGPTNAGKSSLLNTLLNDDKAIVSEIHGTTRDIIDDTIRLGDYTLRIQDTAGIRHTNDPIETLGINRSINAANKAQIIILLIDPTQPIPQPIIPPQINPQPNTLIIAAINKTDLNPPTPNLQTLPPNTPTIQISAKTNHGIDTLRKTITQHLDQTTGTQIDTNAIITNPRHANDLDQAAQALQRMLNALNDPNIPTDLITLDLRQALDHLAAITGTITTPDILTTIFSTFCIGK